LTLKARRESSSKIRRSRSDKWVKGKSSRGGKIAARGVTWLWIAIHLDLEK
jgi:hypothetical protein